MKEQKKNMKRYYPKPPPSVQHLGYFKVWAIANVISAIILAIILIGLVFFITTKSYNMQYQRESLKWLTSVKAKTDISTGVIHEQ